MLTAIAVLAASALALAACHKVRGTAAGRVADGPGMERQFFPAPATEAPAPINWRDGNLLAVACVGQCDSVSQLTGSEFYGLLCQRYPQLRGINTLAVQGAGSTLWLVVPRYPGTALAVTRTDGHTLFATSNLQPVLLRADWPMPHLEISVKAPQGELNGCRPAYRSDADKRLSTNDVPQVVDFTAPNQLNVHPGSWLEAQGGSVRLACCANGQLLLHSGDRRFTGRYVAYRPEVAAPGEVAVAVRMDDGREAAWTMSPASSHTLRVQEVNHFNGAILKDEILLEDKQNRLPATQF